MRSSVLERFWSKVEKTDGCWLWHGTINSRGYGVFWLNDQNRPAHTIAYTLVVGPIPDGLVPDHLCRVRRCVRPDHLEPVTPGENVLRGQGLAAQNAGKTHCSRGHPFDVQNTLISTGGRRICRTCRRMSTAAYERRKRGEVVTIDDCAGAYQDRSRCVHGHLFTPENTRIRVRNGREHRVCIECSRSRGLAHYHRKRALPPATQTRSLDAVRAFFA